MVFSSITFLFFFLPLVLLAYPFAGARMRNGILLVTSLLFYSWGEGAYLLVMLASIGLNYLCGRLIFLGNATKPSRMVLSLGITGNLFLLGYFKYANFLTDNINLLLTHLHLPAVDLTPVHLPVGISFFTFQAISYIVDVYRREVPPQKNIISLSLYISLFPQLIAGPIVRYNQIAAELANRRVTTGDFAAGAERFFYGLAKKVLLANPMAAIADQVFALPAADLTTGLAWLGALCYSLQIYFDFSGYSDMAIGLGKLFGFTFPENFKYPYVSTSIREFWRRWHISLSTWLRDYIYIPLGGNRKTPLWTHINLVLVFFLCGLWHGASWTFIAWGLYHGLFLVLERGAYGRLQSGLWLPLRHILTMLLVIIGWVLFRSETLSAATSYLATMAGLSTTAGGLSLGMILTNKSAFELGCAILFTLPVFPWLQGQAARLVKAPQMQDRTWLQHGFSAVHLGTLGVLSYLTIISLAAGAYNPFIYFRF